MRRVGGHRIRGQRRRGMLRLVARYLATIHARILTPMIIRRADRINALFPYLDIIFVPFPYAGGLQ